MLKNLREELFVFIVIFLITWFFFDKIHIALWYTLTLSVFHYLRKKFKLRGVK